jgi:hypothetical protein
MVIAGRDPASRGLHCAMTSGDRAADASGSRLGSVTGGPGTAAGSAAPSPASTGRAAGLTRASSLDPRVVLRRRTGHGASNGDQRTGGDKKDRTMRQGSFSIFVPSRRLASARPRRVWTARPALAGSSPPHTGIAKVSLERSRDLRGARVIESDRRIARRALCGWHSGRFPWSGRRGWDHMPGRGRR